MQESGDGSATVEGAYVPGECEEIAPARIGRERFVNESSHVLRRDMRREQIDSVSSNGVGIDELPAKGGSREFTDKGLARSTHTNKDHRSLGTLLCGAASGCEALDRRKFDTLHFEANLSNQRQRVVGTAILLASDLIGEVVPPVGPSLLNATLLLDDRIFNHTAQDAEGHRDTMIIVAVDAGAFLQFRDGLAIDLQAIIKLLRLDSELGYNTVNSQISEPTVRLRT